MAKLYLVSLEYNNKDYPSIHWLFKNEEDARHKIDESVGSDILLLLANKDFFANSDVEDAIEYVKGLTPMKGDDDYGCYTKDGKIYVEEVEFKE